MLLKENKAIQKEQKELLRELMSLEALSPYCLVGGTNLAFRYEHRISIDLDIFRYNEEGSAEANGYLFEKIKKTLISRSIDVQNITDIGIFMFVDNIKVDIVEYPYPFFEIEVIDKIRLASLRDIGAMKINAIKGRGTRKDFYDLHQLLKDLSLEEIIELYKEKYNAQNLETVKRSLIYFGDAEDKKYRNNEVVSLLNEDWEHIKETIEEEYQKLFNNSHRNRMKR